MLQCLFPLSLAAALSGLVGYATTLPAAENVVGPKVAGETRYKPHTLVRLRAEGVDAKAGLLWRVYPSDVVQRANTPRGVLEFAAPPGRYEVELLAITTGVDGGFVIDEARAVVVIESCHPPDPPVPPVPPLPPAPPSPLPPVPPSGKLDPANAIGRITFGSAGCSATVVAPRRADGRWDVLTAAHCLERVGQRGTMRMPVSGRTHAVTVVSLDRTRDVAWIVTDESIDDIEYAHLAKVNPPPGAMVWHMGYGVDRPRNREDGSVADSENSKGQIRFILSVSSGDSGGGIFRVDNSEVVGTVCCTSGMAKKVSMWAGSCEQAWKLRPKTPGTGADDGWQPVPIPMRPASTEEGSSRNPRSEWTPAPMPIRSLPSPIDSDGWQPIPMPIRSVVAR